MPTNDSTYSERKPSDCSDGSTLSGDDADEDYIAREEMVAEGEQTRPNRTVGNQAETRFAGRRPVKERFLAAVRAWKADPAQRPTREELKLERYQRKTARQNDYAKWLLATLICQLIAVNVFMWRLLGKNGWDVDSSVVIAFLTGVVAEVIGLVFAVVKATFDRSDEE